MKYKSVGEIKKAPLDELEKILGAKTAQNLLFSLKNNKTK
jgi:hypothetical protein